MSTHKNKNNTEFLLSVNNKRIWEFYNESKLNFEEMSLIFIEMIEKTNILHCTKENTSVILDKIKEINEKLNVFQDFQKELSDIKENIILAVQTTNNSNTNILKTHIDEVKNIFIKELSTDNERHYEKIKLHIYELLPKTNSELLEKIQDKIQLTFHDINFKHYYDRIENKFAELFLSFSTKDETLLAHISKIISDETKFMLDKMKEKSDVTNVENMCIQTLCKNIETHVHSINDKFSFITPIVSNIQDISNSFEEINEQKYQILSQNISTFMKENFTSLQLQDLQQFQTIIHQDMKSLFENQNLAMFIKSFDKSLENINVKINDNSTFILSNISQYNSLLESKLENNILKHSNSYDNFQRDNLEKQKQGFQNFIENQLNQLNSSTINKDTMTIYFNNIERKMQDIESKVEKLDKVKYNSSKKGELSEKELTDVLIDTFRTASITRISFENKNCDILFKDDDDEILIENKAYETNVPEQEVVKFKRDCIHRNTCGIMIQQENGKGICGKQDFEFEIIQNNVVLLYIHSCNYSTDKIKTAINIIKYFKKQLQRTNLANMENDNNVIVSSFEFEKIKKEYQTLIKRYNDSSMSLKNSIKVIKEELDKMMNYLKTSETNVMIELNNFFQFDISNVFFKTDKIKCDICNDLFSRHGIGQHKKHCKKMKETLNLG